MRSEWAGRIDRVLSLVELSKFAPQVQLFIESVRAIVGKQFPAQYCRGRFRRTRRTCHSPICDVSGARKIST